MPRVWCATIHGCARKWKPLAACVGTPNRLAIILHLTRPLFRFHGLYRPCALEPGQREPRTPLRPSVIGMRDQWSTTREWNSMSTPRRPRPLRKPATHNHNPRTGRARTAHIIHTHSGLYMLDAFQRTRLMTWRRSASSCWTTRSWKPR